MGAPFSFFSCSFLLINVTVHIGLRTCCADRRLNWASEQKSHRRRRFSWIFACCCERVNSNVFSDYGSVLGAGFLYFFPSLAYNRENTVQKKNLKLQKNT